jgi:hypothetical protein
VQTVDFRAGQNYGERHPAAQLAEDAVVGNGLADHGGHLRVENRRPGLLGKSTRWLRQPCGQLPCQKSDRLGDKHSSQFRTVSAEILDEHDIVGHVVLLGVQDPALVKSRSARGGANAKFYTGALLLSVPLGLIAYIVSGMIAAALHGGGHFYSVPFGGYTASNDAALASSSLLWIAMVFICLFVTLRPRS